MFATLLATKFFIPQARPQVVSRPLLIGKLNARSAEKLALISAPPGFGKTSLLCEWVNTRHGSDPKIAWLSLDENDNDPVRFFAYFITALKKTATEDNAFGESALAMLQTPQPPPLEAVLTSLLNDLAAFPKKVALVLDDYHLIETQSIHQGLTFILDHLPPQLQLVIATRIDPPIPLARLRARDQLTELRAADLRFNNAETAEFLNQIMGLNLSEQDVRALGTRTEGWIAGLQLAALSMQGSKNPAEFINSFTGSHRYILDYLIEEVLEQQTEPVQEFLLHTALLDRFTAPLCDRLTGREDSQDILESFVHDNLFIVPLDDDRHWFRYHHLFGDLLRVRLQQSRPESIPNLHAHASDWFEEHGLLEDSIKHALQAGVFTKAAELIERLAQDEFVQGEDTNLERWLDALPEDLIAARPQLGVYHAWYLLAKGEAAAADRILQEANRTLIPTNDQDSGTELRGRVATTRAFTAFYRGDVPGIIQHAQLALADLSEKDLAWRSIATHILGDAFSLAGEITDAYQARIEAVEVSQAAGNIFQMIIANLKLAITLRYQGKLSQVIEICQRQKQIAEKFGLERTVLAGWLYGIWGEAVAESGDLDEALRLSEHGASLADRKGDLAMIAWSYICHIRTLFSTRDYQRAEAVITKLEDLNRQTYVPPWMMVIASNWLPRIWLARGNLEAVSQWIDTRGLEPGDAPGYLSDPDYFVMARYLLATDRFDEAAGLLASRHRASEAAGRTSRSILILILLALAAHGQGDTTQAFNWLGQACTLAEPGGSIQTFVDEGPALAGLLYEALSQDFAPDFIRRILAAYPTDVPEPQSPALLQGSDGEFFEPLSDREIEVLQLIGEGLSNKEIAARLFLSLNTVKGHTRNIYGKLGANNRTQAFTRARALGILRSD